MATQQRRLLEGILCDDQQRKEFQDFLTSIHCDENIHFLDELTAFKTLLDSNTLETAADVLWNKYFSPSASTQLNLDATTMERLVESMAKPKSTTTFDSALEEVYSMLEFDSLPKFLRSSQYKSMFVLVCCEVSVSPTQLYSPANWER